MKKTFAYLILISLIWACSKDQMPLLIELDMELQQLIKQASPDGTTEFYILPNEHDLAAIPQDPKNPLTPAKVELGRFLFFETGIAIDAVRESGIGTYSCSSCHIPEAGFRPGNFQGIADGGTGFGVNGESRRRNPEYAENELDVQSARPLSILNVAYVKNTFWNGQFGSTGINTGTEDLWDLSPDTEINHLGFEGIESQNFEGVITHRLNVNKPLLDEFGYTDLFDAAFPELSEEDRYSQVGTSLALSAYIRTVLANRAPFQEWLKGNFDALSYEEKKGGILFFGKANCSNCHYNQNLGSLEFHALGVRDMDQIPSYNSSPSDKRNLGRGGFTQNPDDNYKFKVPQLYNLTGTPFYFHGASKRNLEELIEYLDKAESENERVAQELLSEKFVPLGLTDEEKKHLKIFLEKSLDDPDLHRYKPDHLKSGNCFPNNDFQSVLDLGCN